LLDARAYGQYATRSRSESPMSTPLLDSTEVREAGTARGLIASVVSDAQRLVALEIALAKQEAKELATGNAIAAGLIAFGGLLLVLAVLVGLPSLVVWLLPWHWQAAAVWVAAYVVIGLVLVIIGRARLQLRLPPRTIGSLKENKEWALRRVRSNGK
jgi:small-conductance mechanosensitive channel